ncbi:mediator of RNA polymerase II transcription subunit 15-like, partial [Watersipora subatra]|uniref:mediator of RNA polymerase II transcription subunit 15-like n=1 Tax=Watersipora subatra TaxID=2589382 RepID=UPI00355B92E8
MADDMIGTLFESDATSILNSEASNLLTELESMASTTDPGQPPPRPPAQQNPFFDYAGGQAMQSPVSQPIHSPAGSIHSPGAMISPSTSHFGSPPPQQATTLQRQMSNSHQYPTYPPHSMQQGAPSPGTTGPLWRMSPGQSGYPGSAPPPQSAQRAVASTYNMPQAPPQHAGHMPPPGHPSGHPSQQYMAHPNQLPQAKHHGTQLQPTPASMQTHESYRQMQMQYRQMAPSYMHPGMSSQHISTPHQQHVISQQPRMPRPGMASYSNHVMHQRMPHHSMMGPPANAQMMSPGGAEAGMHQQQMQQQYLHPQHYSPIGQQHAEMLPPSHYSSIGQMRAQVGQSVPGSPYSYAQQPLPPTQQVSQSYGVPQSSPHYSMPSNHPPQTPQTPQTPPTPQTPQNSSSLEQLEKMVSPLNQQNQQAMPSSPMSGGYPSQSPLLSPRSHHSQSLPAAQDIPPSRHHMVSPQGSSSSVPSGSIQSPMHVQQYAMQPPQPQLTPLETIAKEIEIFEHKVRQLQSMPPPYHPEQEKELRAVEERLRSLNSQQTMMLDDVKQAQSKEVEKGDPSVSTP